MADVQGGDCPWLETWQQHFDDKSLQNINKYIMILWLSQPYVCLYSVA
jgi:hypothetical protein